ncbi:hypothetical protein F4780DRAFT_778633 [Xylariomycetidae sp. FL0641]|nr:hypothetical protein F4780DRAFT_778633 [Xylariomycetidae sp. FL0641]
MHCCGATTLSFWACFVAAALAGDFAADNLQQDFQMGLLARQAQNLVVEGPANLNITKSDDPDHPFEVDGETVPAFQDAINKACDGQANQCQDAANSGGDVSTFSANDCDDQKNQCHDQLGSQVQTAFLSLASENADFQFLCED